MSIKHAKILSWITLTITIGIIILSVLYALNNNEVFNFGVASTFFAVMFLFLPDISAVLITSRMKRVNRTAIIGLCVMLISIIFLIVVVKAPGLYKFLNNALYPIYPTPFSIIIAFLFAHMTGLIMLNFGAGKIKREDENLFKTTNPST